ncbi:hypothetical protein SERLADRAFT_435565 [Serpula lacrymans var. lacrymans S7.9]|uniref:Alpha/beta hydrolase fold-3 domain-containing protein n=1 Tax=Serpula lacrymans var. lacrymans (strain S7.9) TaxID=578457 RepID=F8NM11_SERL9|nr:uncharacterized protein SERLADRAFT_435565 [Serpula lacrymans var. lacrymans S7.9]EGO27799.1 hypothetical protein SERLADRAFT_435565 [Serpula lacrymans var. lacrymans S7.9]
MPVSTFSAAANITPVVVKTFYTHSKRKGKKLREHVKEDEARDDIFFDEAFNIVKAFILMGTKNTVESLQAFTNTHVPASPWAAVCPVRIPFYSCNRAADILIDWFGPEDLKLIVGGEKWWQVRGLDGIDGEWIAEKGQLSDEKFNINSTQKLTDSQKEIKRMEQLETVMLYVHGGGYFWGSISNLNNYLYQRYLNLLFPPADTHRYQILRYARKAKGRAFAVNYRKAPQYPWPCPLQDVLAAYLYLIDPPPNAVHQAVPASKIVFAGDSAGGGLALTVLTILRDVGMPLPAGAVLISPWVDLTHSFPSIMKNTETDIIPPHGFLSKPSVLWPVDVIKDGGRVTKAQSNPPPKPGHADTMWPEQGRVKKMMKRSQGHTKVPKDVGKEKSPQPQDTMMSFEHGKDDMENNMGGVDGASANTDKRGTYKVESSLPHGEGLIDGRGPDSRPSLPDPDDIDFWQPKPPKVLMKDPHSVPLELRSQIQQYATTEQLSHPLVSPILQGSLGNLCPLYIITGDGEVLRDEIIYLAHRAAHPDEYPVREGILRDGWRQKENAKKFTKPTKVHLQVLQAKYAYRSIAEFVKHVTQNSDEHLAQNPFPELHRPASHISSDSHSDKQNKTSHQPKHKHKEKVVDKSVPLHHTTSKSSPSQKEKTDVQLYKENEDELEKQIQNHKAEQVPCLAHGDMPSVRVVRDQEHDIPNVLMIRERVDIRGHVRAMEPKDQIPALALKPAEVGIIKEDPLFKWLQGQEEWDKRYRKTAEKVIKKRLEYTAKALLMISHAREQGLILEGEGRTGSSPTRPKTERVSSSATGSSSRTTHGKIQEDRRWGPLDLADERPPPSAIAARLDTPEALALIKKSIYHTAPATHKTVPKMKTSDAIRAAFDPNDDPYRPPDQSVSEQQVRTSVMHIHGLRVWESLVSYFMRKSSMKAGNGVRAAGSLVAGAGNKIGVTSSD